MKYSKNQAKEYNIQNQCEFNVLGFIFPTVATRHPFVFHHWVAYICSTYLELFSGKIHLKEKPYCSQPLLRIVFLITENGPNSAEFYSHLIVLGTLFLN